MATAAGRQRRRAPGGATLAMAVAALVVAAGTAGGLCRALALRAAWPPDTAALALPPTPALRALSFGHSQLMADLLIARANVTFGDADTTALERYLTAAAELDPGMRDRYLRGAAMLVYGARPITAAAVLAADRLLARGAEALPGDWELWFQLGFNQLFELPHLAADGDARRPLWRRGGVAALQRAARLPGAPPWLATLPAQLLAADGDTAAALAYLTDVAAQSTDPATRALLVRQLEALRRHSDIDRRQPPGKGSAP